MSEEEAGGGQQQQSATPVVFGGGGDGGQQAQNVEALALQMDWKQAIPEELRADQTISQIKAVTPGEAIATLSDQLVNAQKMVGADKVLRPKPEWEADKMKAWREDVLGIPTDPAKYEIKPEVPEGIDLDTAALESWKQFFFDQGVSPTAANAMISRYLDEVATQASGEAEVSQQQQNRWKAQMMQEWGDQYTARLDRANASLVHLMKAAGIDLGFAEEIAKLPLSKDPRFIKLFDAAGQLSSEDRMVNTFGGTAPRSPQRMTPGEALTAIQQLEMSEDYTEAIIKNPTNPEFKDKREALIKQRAQLYEVAYDTGPKAASAPSGLQG